MTTGSYTGSAGAITLNTYLAGDGAPSDKLIVNAGTATGTTGLTVHNTTGPGAETQANGIQVVQALNGGTTASDAFTLTNRLRAGASDYFLFHGEIGGSNPNADATRGRLRMINGHPSRARPGSRFTRRSQHSQQADP